MTDSILLLVLSPIDMVTQAPGILLNSLSDSYSYLLQQKKTQLELVMRIVSKFYNYILNGYVSQMSEEIE